MSKIEITEDKPLSYTAHDGAVIVVSVAGPIESVYTLTVNGQRELTHRNEDFVRSVARNIAEVRNARWAEAMKAATGTSVLIDDIAPLPALGSLTAEPEKTIAEMTPQERDATVRRAVATFQDELDALPPRMASPLPVDEQRCSGLAGGGAAANAMSEPARRKLIIARDNLIRPGRIARGGHEWEANVRMLRALARRGWLTLDNPIQPRYGDLTDAGRKALARELASMGGAR